MGFIATGDDYGLKSDIVFEGMNQVVKVVDDLAAFDATFQDHVNTVRDILTRCRRHGVTLNAKKFQFGQQNVEFAGFRLSPEGVGADPEKLAAVARFPRPTNISQMRSFMGLVEQLAAPEGQERFRLGRSA